LLRRYGQRTAFHAVAVEADAVVEVEAQHVAAVEAQHVAAVEAERVPRQVRRTIEVLP
jgi:hypothetical protein